VISCDRRKCPGRGSRGLTLSAEDDRLTPDREQRYEERATDRLTLFSDAVAAIAITLLAIDLPVPDGSNVAELWSQVRDNDGHYAAFLISFTAIAAAWSSHHDLFRYVKRTDARLRSLNMAWLFTIVVTPFATRLLTASAHPTPTLDTHALRFGFYALIQMLESVALADLDPDGRLRPVHPVLLRRALRLGVLVRGPHSDRPPPPAAPPPPSRSN
jgi:uncharacterized membrane protein